MGNQVVLRCSVFAIIAIFANSNALAARYVPVSIVIDGTVIFEGNASDDGEPDADEVWEAVKKSNLEPTKAFEALKIDSNGKEIELSAKDTIDDDGRKRITNWVEIKVAYGGFVRTSKLKLQRVEPDGAGRVWRIASKDLDELFDDRYVKRSDVERIKEPSYAKWKEKSR